MCDKTHPLPSRNPGKNVCLFRVNASNFLLLCFVTSTDLKLFCFK